MADEPTPHEEAAPVSLDKEVATGDPTPTDPVLDEIAQGLVDDIVVPVVRIGGPGLPTHTLDFQADITVGDWLRRVGVTLREGQTVNVNGQRAELNQVLQPESSITVASRVNNG